MRKFLIPLLLASAALPTSAIAGDEDRDAARAARAEQRIERSQQRMERADRPERADRQERAARPDRAESQQQQQQVQQAQQPQPREMREMRQMRVDRAPEAQPQGDARQLERQQRRMERAPRNWVEGGPAQPTARPDDAMPDRANRGPRVITTDGLPADVSQERLQRGDRIDRGDRLQRNERLQRSERMDRSEERALARRTRMPGLPPMAGQSPRPGSGGGLVSTPLPNGGELRRSGSGSQWGTHWRGDRRYDWRGHRNRHRRSFNLSLYIDPFGFGYQRMNYGWRLFPSYYRSSYWLNDPWQYRLPPAYGPYRWVRYWDDALLVDIYSGEVVDVIHDFFW